MKRGSLEAIFSESGRTAVANLAKPVAVPAPVVRQNSPTNLKLTHDGEDDKNLTL